MLLSTKPMMAATATKMAVQAPWAETAFKPIDMPSMPAPATKIQTGGPGQYREDDRPLIARRTENKHHTEKLAPDASKEQLADVVDAVDGSMAQLEDTDHVVGPGGDDGDGDQDDDARHHAEDVEDGRYGQNPQADLGLHHQHGGAHPADVAVVGTVVTDLAKDIVDDGNATTVCRVASFLWIVHVLRVFGDFFHCFSRGRPPVVVTEEGEV